MCNLAYWLMIAIVGLIYALDNLQRRRLRRVRGELIQLLDAVNAAVEVNDKMHASMMKYIRGVARHSLPAELARKVKDDSK